MFSYNKLRQTFSVGSTNTVIDYVSYLEDSYLFFLVPKFDYSYKKSSVNPKKIYSVDVGLSDANSVSFSSDKGRILENIVFLSLRKENKDIFYFKEKHECDFIVSKNGEVLKAVQVCYNLTEENKDRELNGLKEAMEKLNVKEGIIVTFNQEDNLEGVKVIPAWKFVK